MISFGLKVGAVSLGLPATGINDLGNFVAGHLYQGSGAVVQLTPQPPVQLPFPLNPGQATSALRLHQSLKILLGNADTLPVRHLGLLLAHSFQADPGIFGLMFDVGFTTPDDPNGGAFIQIPRQGCALFLGAILQSRGPAMYERQLGFTSVHEVGHIFNLLHQSSPLTFMAPSRADGPYGNAAYFFGTSQRNWLARCAVDQRVMPGGSRFLDLGYNDGTSSEPKTDLTLRADLTSSSFWRFEPVQLNLKLSIKKRALSRRVVVAKELDPGYQSFRIVIQDAGGQIRLYRSPLRFCARSEKIFVTRENPYARDLPVFGQAGGYTFDRPGIYRLWAEFDYKNLSTLRSNKVEFEVLPDASRSRSFRHLRTVLGDAHAARSLFYGEMTLSRAQSIMRSLDEANSKGESCEIIRFACAKAVVSRAPDNKQSKSWASRQFLEALDSGKLPTHQRVRAEQRLAQLDGRF